MADDVLDFLKGFSADDYDLDLGIQFVDEKPGRTGNSDETRFLLREAQLNSQNPSILEAD